MDGKQFFDTTNPFEQRFGYHRAVRKGAFIFVSGTTALKLNDEAVVKDDVEGDSKVHYPKDARKQAKLAMERCISAVDGLGGKLSDVVRVRMFVSNHDDCLGIGAAYRECFTDDEPNSEVGAAATMVVVQNGFVDPDILVEVEVDAVNF